MVWLQKIDPPGWNKNAPVLPFQTILSYSHKGKYSSLVSHQAAKTARLCTGSTWEFSSKYILDRKQPSTGMSLRQILLSLSPTVFPSTPLFHSVDRMWRSTTGVTLSFLIENEMEARSIIAGLIPFIKETYSPWFLQFFTEEAKVRHATSKWDAKTRSVYSAEEVEIDGLLAEDEEMYQLDNQNGMPMPNNPAGEIHKPTW
jgi:hypothetical protein